MTSSSTSHSKDSSLWLQLLRQSSSRALAPEASCLFVGDVNAGKRSLLTKIGQNDDFSRQPSFLELVNYDFFEVDDGSLDSASKVHLWGFDERIFSQSTDFLSPENSSSKMMFIIALDLSKGEEILVSLRKWFGMIAQFILSYQQSMTSDQVLSMKQQFLQYISTVRLNKGNKLDGESYGEEINHVSLSATSSKYELAVDKFPIPIVVVGCKADLINYNDLLIMKNMKEIQGKLRFLCLEASAALFFSGKEQDHARLQTLKKYILHRLYPESISMDLSIEVSYLASNLISPILTIFSNCLGKIG